MNHTTNLLLRITTLIYQYDDESGNTKKRKYNEEKVKYKKKLKGNSFGGEWLQKYREKINNFHF